MKHVEVTLHSDAPPVVLILRVAETKDEYETGLMDVDEIGPASGMLFVSTEAAPRRFWMKNTRLPLDILFFDADDVLYKIHRSAVPYSESMIWSDGLAKNVIELEAGICDVQGISIGVSMVIESAIQ